MKTSQNNKRIAKNTLMLYVRMAITMCISIFTTRVLLQALGETDYGLVNLIGGVVMMFSFISGTMNTAVSRYITFELGRGDRCRLKQVVNLSQLIFFALIVLLLFFGETLGLWFFKTYLVLPPERADSAFWFFQFSIFAFLLSIANTPFIALVIAHEDMKIFAWASIFESITKLLIVYLLYLSSLDHLVLYGALLILISLMHFAIYFIVCYLKYPESRFSYFFEKNLFKSLMFFGGWNIWGALSNLFTNIFVNVLLNNYFGPITNTARGISNQLSSAIASFTGNFFTAVNPQITKYYAANELEQSYLLTMLSSRFGFFLMYLILLPVWLLCPFMLNLWLGTVPAYTICFLRLILIQLQIDSISYPLMTLAQASGRIALYQSVVGGTLWLNLPFTWIMFHLGFSPWTFGVVAVLISLLCMVLRLVLVHRCARLPLMDYVSKVLIPVGRVLVVAAILPVSMNFLLFDDDPGFYQFITVSVICVISCISAVFVFGVSKEERVVFLKIARQRLGC